MHQAINQLNLNFKISLSRPKGYVRVASIVLLLFAVGMTNVAFAQTSGSTTTFPINSDSPGVVVATLHKGDFITYTGTLLSTDPNDATEYEPLVLVSSTGTTLKTLTIAGQNSGSYTAVVEGEQLSAYISGDDGDESGTLSVTVGPQLQVTTDKPEYHIDPAGPTMEVIKAKVQIMAVTPDPTATTPFTWSLKVHFEPSPYPHGSGHNRPIDYQWPDAMMTGADFVPDFNGVVRGGDLTIKATAIVGGHTLTGQTVVRVVGTNPSQEQIKSYLPNYVLAQIVLKESSNQQFANPGHGYPKWSEDDRGGVGLTQLTNPAPSDDQVWNWKKNADGGIAKLNAAAYTQGGNANDYPGIVQGYDSFAQLVNKYNLMRQAQGFVPLQQVTVPPFTTGNFDNNPQQLERDAIRLYNGNDFPEARDPLFSTPGSSAPLHEYTLETDSKGFLVIVNASNKPVGKADTVGYVVWRVVMPLERQRDGQNPKHGDLNYVGDVLGETP